MILSHQQPITRTSHSFQLTSTFHSIRHHLAFITHTMYKTIQWDTKHNSQPTNLYQSLKRSLTTIQQLSNSKCSINNSIKSCLELHRHKKTASDALSNLAVFRSLQPNDQHQRLSIFNSTWIISSSFLNRLYRSSLNSPGFLAQNPQSHQPTQ